MLRALRDGILVSHTQDHHRPPQSLVAILPLPLVPLLSPLSLLSLARIPHYQVQRSPLLLAVLGTIAMSCRPRSYILDRGARNVCKMHHFLHVCFGLACTASQNVGVFVLMIRKSEVIWIFNERRHLYYCPYFISDQRPRPFLLCARRPRIFLEPLSAYKSHIVICFIFTFGRLFIVDRFCPFSPSASLVVPSLYKNVTFSHYFVPKGNCPHQITLLSWLLLNKYPRLRVQNGLYSKQCPKAVLDLMTPFLTAKLLHRATTSTKPQ